MDPIHVAIAEDHRLVREGIIRIIEGFHDMKVVWEAENGEDLLKHLNARKQLPDVLLLDIEMPEMDAFKALPAIRQTFGKKPRILILTQHDNDAFIRKSIRLGADGYLLKHVEPAELETAIRTVKSTGRYLSLRVQEVIFADYQSSEVTHPESDIPLSEREIEVLKLVCQQKKTKEIADEIHLSERTVEDYRKSLMEKTGSATPVGLALWAMKSGLLGRWMEE
jgi:DNA-binding NarL/FixJ family response regulator